MPSFFSPYGTDAISVGIPYWLDLLTVIIGAISGILVARDRHLDLVGFVGLGLLGGLGGGLIRDVMMQEGGVYMLNSPYAIPAAVFTAVLLFMFPEPLDRFPRMLEWTDIISVGLFAVVGTDKALVYHLLPFSVILMGSITGVGGGMLRDVFLGDIPRISSEAISTRFAQLLALPHIGHLFPTLESPKSGQPLSALQLPFA